MHGIDSTDRKFTIANELLLSRSWARGNSKTIQIIEKMPLTSNFSLSEMCSLSSQTNPICFIQMALVNKTVRKQLSVMGKCW